MRGRLLGALVGGLVLMTFGGPAPAAQGKPGYIVFPGSRENSFSVKGSNGYKVTVSHINRRVELHASNGDAAAIYVVGAPKPSPDGTIEARFPGRGRISVRFQPAGPPRRSPTFFPECDGEGEVHQRGTFTGTIRFQGEEGFTRVVASRARGALDRASKEVCKRSDIDNRSQPDPSYWLAAFDGSPARAVSFTALRPAPGSMFDREATYFGNSFERRHGMTTVRVAVADADEDTFEVAGPRARPVSAEVSPPAPFEGTATFGRTAEEPFAWEGTLTVDLPGERGVRLTGPSFQARLCFEQRCTNRPIPAVAGLRGRR